MASPIGQGILSFAIHLPEFVGFATLEALRCRAVALRADPFVTFQNAVDGSHRQRRGFFVAQQYLQFFRTPPGLLTQRHHALLLPRFRAARTPMRPSTTLGQLRQTAALLVSPLPQISRRARNPEFAAEHRESLLLALRSNHKLHALLAHIHLVPRHGFQPPRPETLTAGVKHVLATTVKDVLAPYTSDRFIHLRFAKKVSAQFVNAILDASTPLFRTTQLDLLIRHFERSEKSLFALARLISPAPPHQSSPAPSNTPRPSPAAPAHIPPTPHREYPAHSASHPRSSTPHTRTLPRSPTIPHNSAVSASTLPPPWHAPQNSHTQTPPGGPSVLPCGEIYQCRSWVRFSHVH